MIEFFVITAIMSYPITFIMQLIYELQLYKFLADCGYKVNFNNCKQIKEDITDETDYKFNNEFIPFVNIYNVLKRGINLAYLDNFVLEEYERSKFIEKMTALEKKEYEKSKTGFKALMIGIKRTNKDFVKYKVELNMDSKKSSLLVQYNIPYDKIRILRIRGYKKIDLKDFEKELLESIHERLGINSKMENENLNNIKDNDYNSKKEKLEKEKEYYQRLIKAINSRKEELEQVNEKIKEENEDNFKGKSI